LIYITRDEAAAFDWMAANVPAGSVVLAAPETGMYLPARTDARVIYGHEFETVNAAANQQAVEDFFAGATAPDSFVARHHVDFVYYGPRERELGPPPELEGWRVVSTHGEVVIYGR
jgi:hypothetical protein